MNVGQRVYTSKAERCVLNRVCFPEKAMGKDFLNRVNIIKSLLNMIRLTALACITVFLFSSQALAGIVESGELTEASRWILNNNAGDQVILDEEQLEAFNQKIHAADLDVTDMKQAFAIVKDSVFKAVVLSNDY